MQATLVKMAARQNPPHRFNPHPRGACAGVRNNLSPKPSIPQMILVTLAGDDVLIHSVMGQDTSGLFLAL